MLGQREYHKGQRWAYRYFSNRITGAKSIALNEMQAGIENAFQTKTEYFKKLLGRKRESVKNIFSDFKSSNLKKTPEEVEKLANENIRGRLLTNFLAVALNRPYNKVYRDITSKIPDGPILHTIYTNYINLLDRLDKAWVDKNNPSFDIASFLNDNERFARDISDIFIQSNSKEDQILTYINGEGKRLYLRVASSFAHDVVKVIEDRGIEGAKKRFKYLTTAFYSNNIFVNGFNKIYRYVDHDSTGIKGSNYGVKTASKENRYEWMSRVFNTMFSGYIMDNKGGPLTYIQPSFVPADKRTLSGFEVNVIKAEDIKPAIRRLVEQEMHLPDVVVKGYDRNRSALLGLTTVAKNKKQVDEFTEIVYAELMKKGEELVDQWLKDGLMPDVRIEELYKKLGLDPVVFEKKAKEIVLDETDIAEGIDIVIDTEDEVSADITENELKEQQEEELEEEVSLREKLLPLIGLFNANFYINSKQISQLSLGAEQFYSNLYMQNKRMAIVQAPKRKGAVLDGVFMDSTWKVAVAEDLKAFVKYLPGTPEETIGTEFDAADGATFITPEAWTQLRLGFGVESEMGLVMKPIISGISDEGVPIGIKMAITVLTDEFVNQFPEWQSMRDAMRQKDVKMLTFDSAVKMGAPAKSVKLNKKGTFDAIDGDAIIDLDTRFFGLIYNPTADTISLDQANPSQMKFLPMTNPENMAQHHRLIELDGEMYRTGIILLDRLLRLKDGKPSKKGITVTRTTSSGRKTVETNRTNESIRERLLKSFSRVAGSEAEWGLLYNLPNLSINLPVLTTKAVSAINALFTSKTTGQKYKGGKLVLAPEFGTYSAEKLKLKWKDKDGNTEVYLPESIAKDMGIQPGDIVTMNMR